MMSATSIPLSHPLEQGALRKTCFRSNPSFYNASSRLADFVKTQVAQASTDP